jgi:cation transport regulator
MPYRRVSELPYAVRDYLPEHAQDIYMRAFNSAWDQYADPSKRRTKGTREATAHRVAWSAVERLYEKCPNGRWQKRKDARAG